MTESILTLEVGEKDFEFMVATGAFVSVIEPGISRAHVLPCYVRARGITGTQLEVLGEQEVEFTLRNQEYSGSFVHTFLVSPLKRCSSGILGMDFLQRVGAEISLTPRLLHIGHHSFLLRGQELGVLTVQRLIKGGQKGPSGRGKEECEDEPGEDWEGTVQLAEAVTVPHFL